MFKIALFVSTKYNKNDNKYYGTFNNLKIIMPCIALACLHTCMVCGIHVKYSYYFVPAARQRYRI